MRCSSPIFWRSCSQSAPQLRQMRNKKHLEQTVPPEEGHARGRETVDQFGQKIGERITGEVLEQTTSGKVDVGGLGGVNMVRIFASRTSVSASNILWSARREPENARREPYISRLSKPKKYPPRKKVRDWNQK